MKTDLAPEGVKTFENSIKNEPLEHGQYFDANGKPLSEVIQGSESSIDISSGKSIAKDATFSHNHPNNGTFSSADLTTASNYDMAEMRAITDNGTYSMKRGPEGWKPKTPREMDAVFNENKAKLRNDPDAQRLYRQGNHAAVNDMLMNSIAKDIGGVYTRH